MATVSECICDKCGKNGAMIFSDHLFYAGDDCFFRMSMNNSNVHNGYKDLCKDCAILLLANCIKLVNEGKVTDKAIIQ